MKPLTALTVLVAASALGVCAHAAQPAAGDPGLTGMWRLKGDDYERREAMPFKPAAKEMDDRRRHAREQEGQVLEANDKKCLPVGMPIFMANEFALEILPSPGRITMLSEYSTLPRSIYLNEKVHTPGLEPSWNGHSIGHWEGKTLVVDTVNLNDRLGPLMNKGVHSPTTHIVERIKRTGAGAMIDAMTFEDPTYLTKPWTMTLTFEKLEPGAELWEYACEVDAPGWSERFAGENAKKAAAP